MITTANVKTFTNKIACDYANLIVNANGSSSIHFFPMMEKRGNTHEFVLYQNAEGKFYFRRLVYTMFGTVNPYQLFRNTSGYNYRWQQFDTIGEAIECFQLYLGRLANNEF